MFPQDAALETLPVRFGRYELRAKLAEGGMASVYLAHDMEQGPSASPVAIKVIKPAYARNPEFVTMLLDESRIASLMVHPHVVRVFEHGRVADWPYLSMELLRGQSLWSVWDELRARGVRLRYDMAAYIGAKVADGLHYAHELKDPAGRPLEVVHRDVNPSNIFLTYDGQVKVIDFGLAKAKNRLSKTQAGVVKGKLAYMSPEQAVGEPIDRRTDVFALATSLWEITVDDRLFKTKDDLETLRRVHAAEIPDPTKLVEGYPARLWAVLQKALARDKNDRYPTAEAFARELEACARAIGREVGATDVADVLRALFDGERQREEAWLAEASNPAVIPPATPMRPVSTHHVEENRPPSSAERASQTGLAAAPDTAGELFAPPPHRMDAPSGATPVAVPTSPGATMAFAAPHAPTAVANPAAAPARPDRTLPSEGVAPAPSTVPTVPRSFRPLPVPPAGEERASLSESALVAAIRGRTRNRILAVALAAVVLVAVVLLAVSQSSSQP